MKEFSSYIFSIKYSEVSGYSNVQRAAKRFIQATAALAGIEPFFLNFNIRWPVGVSVVSLLSNEYYLYAGFSIPKV